MPPVCRALFCFTMLHPPQRSTLFPYTTLFRSANTFPRMVGLINDTPDDARRRNCNSIKRIFDHGVVGRHNCSIRSEEHTSELQSRRELVCRLLLDKKKTMVW